MAPFNLSCDGSCLSADMFDCADECIEPDSVGPSCVAAAFYATPPGQISDEWSVAEHRHCTLLQKTTWASGSAASDSDVESLREAERRMVEMMELWGRYKDGRSARKSVWLTRAHPRSNLRSSIRKGAEIYDRVLGPRIAKEDLGQRIWFLLGGEFPWWLCESLSE